MTVRLAVKKLCRGRQEYEIIENLEDGTMKIFSVFDPEFRAFGKVLEGYDFTELFRALKEIPLPEQGIRYVASAPELEALEVFEDLQTRGFGGIPIQIGCCLGSNRELNCLEYHKSSEFNLTADDICLMLGQEGEIEDNRFDTSRIKTFYVPAGTGVELYGTTLHYAPCQMGGNAFRVACVLPKGTNEPGCLAEKRIGEDALYLGVNKWLLAHKDSEEAAQGAFVGLTGENISLTGTDR